MTKRRTLALGAAAAIGLGSLFAASPALAVDTGEITSVTEGQVFDTASAPKTFEGTVGTLEDGDELVLLVDGPGDIREEVDVTPENGAWSATVDYEAVDGVYAANFGVRLGEGGISYLDTVNFRVGSGTLPLVVIGPAEGDTEYIQVEAPYGTNGTGEPGAEITAELVSAAGTNYSGSTTAGTDGAWSFSFTEDFSNIAVGDYSLTVTQNADGDTESIVREFSVVATPYALPTIDTYQSAGIYNSPVTALSGTGEPGAVLTIDANLYDVESGQYLVDQTYENVPVQADGTWTLALDPALAASGEADVYVAQSIDGAYAHYASAYFQLLDPVTIVAPAAGSVVAPAAAPTGASGTAPYIVDYSGAAVETTVAVTLTTAAGAEQFQAPVTAEGTWAVDFGRALPIGEYTVSAVQVFADPLMQESNFLTPAEAAFSVADPAATPGGPGGGPAEYLPNTGGAPVLPLAAGAAALALLGGTALMLVRRKAALGV